MESKPKQQKTESSFKPNVIIKNVLSAYEYSLKQVSKKKVHFVGVDGDDKNVGSIRKRLKAMRPTGRGEGQEIKKQPEIVQCVIEEDFPEEIETDKALSQKPAPKPSVGQSYKEPRRINKDDYEDVMKTPEFLQHFFNKNNRMQIDDDRLKEIHKDWKAYCKPHMHLDCRRDPERFKPVLHKDEQGMNQLFWVSYIQTDQKHVKRVMDFYKKLDRTLIVITGTHGDEDGKTIFTHPIIEEQGHGTSENDYIEDATKFFGQDFKMFQNYCTGYMRNRCSIQMVSKKQWPITYSKVDAIFAWCFSEKTLNNHMYEDPKRPGVWGPKPKEDERDIESNTFGSSLRSPILTHNIENRFKGQVRAICLVEQAKGTFILVSHGNRSYPQGDENRSHGGLISTFSVNINHDDLEQQAAFEHVRTAKYHDDIIWSIKYCNDSKQKCVYTCSQDHRVRGWWFSAFDSTDSPEFMYEDCTHLNSVTDVICIPDVGVISGDTNGTILFNPHPYCEDKEAKWALNEVACDQVECLVDCGFNKYFAVGTRLNVLVMQYDKFDMLPIKLEGHRALITALKMANYGEYRMLFSASRDMTMKVWNLNDLGSENMKYMYTFEGGHMHKINDIEFFGKYILTIGDDRRIQVWDSEFNSKRQGWQETPIKTIKMKGFGKKLLVHGQTMIGVGGDYVNGEAKVWQFNWTSKK